MGPFSDSKEMILSLFLPTDVQVMPGQCIYNLTSDNITEKHQKCLYGEASIPSFYLWLNKFHFFT